MRWATLTAPSAGKLAQFRCHKTNPAGVAEDDNLRGPRFLDLLHELNEASQEIRCRDERGKAKEGCSPRDEGLHRPCDSGSRESLLDPLLLSFHQSGSSPEKSNIGNAVASSCASLPTSQGPPSTFVTQAVGLTTLFMDSCETRPAQVREARVSTRGGAGNAPDPGVRQ